MKDPTDGTTIDMFEPGMAHSTEVAAVPEKPKFTVVNLADRRAVATPETSHPGSWTPRDALLRTLKEIESGEWPLGSVIIIGCVHDEDGETRTGYRHAIKPGLPSIWSITMIEIAKLRLLGLIE